MIFDSKLHQKFGENLIFGLLKKTCRFYDSKITNLIPTILEITVKIRLIHSSLFTGR